MLMNTRNGQDSPLRRAALPASVLLAAAVLFAASRYNYLLFHSLVELFSVVVGFAVFILAWNTRRIQENHYLLFLGIALLFTGALELLHALAYKGLGVFPGHTANLATQLWIAFRYVLALSFLAAPLFLSRKLNVAGMVALYGLVVTALIAAIFGGLFPDCFTAAGGLTPFKTYSEYAITLLFLAALGLLLRHRTSFDPRILRLMSGALLCAVAAELAFTEYVSVFGPANMIGHFCMLASVTFIYRAIVMTGVVDPSRLLFRTLKLSEQALKESEERLTWALQAGGGGAWDWDLTTGVAWWSPEQYELWGVPAGTVMRLENSIMNIHPGDRERIRAATDEAIARRTDYRCEFRLNHPDRGQRWMASFGRAVYDGTGTPLRLLGISQDITERKQVEESLRRTRDELERDVEARTKELREAGEQVRVERERLYSVMETLPVYVVLLTADHLVPFANRYFRERFGESGGKHCYEYLYQRSEPCEICETYTVLQTGAPHHWEWAGPDGRNYDIYDYPFTDTDGSKLILEMGIDVTERKDAERQLREVNRSLDSRVMERTAELLAANETLRAARIASLNLMEDAIAARRELEASNKELEAFNYSISHDLRAPLRIIGGFVKALEEDYGGELNEKAREYLARISKGTAKMTRLIDELMQLLRVSRQRSERSVVDLSTLASSVVTALREENPARDVEVRVQSGLSASVDPVLMEIVFSNLIGNAWKFTSRTEKALIEFGAMEPENGDTKGKTVYYVKDNGVGFDPALVDKIFLPFHRLHSEKDFEGTGIGLAIVEKVIRVHGGKVWATGAVGKGATVYFTPA